MTACHAGRTKKNWGLARSHLRGQGVVFLAAPGTSRVFPLFPIAYPLLAEQAGASTGATCPTMSASLPPPGQSQPLPAAAPSASPDQNGTSATSIVPLITMRDLLDIVPFSRQHILRLEKRGRFPRRLRLGENRVAWLRSEIEEWIDARVAERGQGRS